MAFIATQFSPTVDNKQNITYQILVPYTDPNIVDADGAPIELFRKEQTTIAQQTQNIAATRGQIASLENQIAEYQAKIDAMNAVE